MNKKIISLIVFASLFCLANFALATVIIPNPLSYGNFKDLLTKGIIPAVATVIGSLATLMLIIAGIFYLTSAGSPERIGTAKKALFYAIIGMSIALAASSIASIICTALGTTC